MKKFTQHLSIGAYHTNQYTQVSVSSLFNFMIEAAWLHAQVMEWGYEDLKTNNMFWVLSRVYIEFENYPKWQDEIELETWSAGTDGMYAYREFILKDQAGEVILRANTAWLILDVESKRIFRLRELKDTFPRLEGVQVCRQPKRIKPEGRAEELFFQPVRFSELDINRHFNSVKYIERVLDHFGIDYLNEHELESLEVNYLKEGLAGDCLAVNTKLLNEQAFLSTIVRESDDVDLCSVKTKWRARKS